MLTRVQSLVFVVVVAMCSVVAVAQPRLVEVRPPGATSTYPVSLSADGTTVLGIAYFPNPRLFVWSDATGYQFLNDPSNTAIVGTGVTPSREAVGSMTIVVDPSIPVGQPRQTTRGGIWSGGEYSQLTVLPSLLRNINYATFAYSLSGDGSTVVGAEEFFLSPTRVISRPAVWNSGFPRGLPVGFGSRAVSYDGSVIVGQVGQNAAIWRTPGRLQILPQLPGMSSAVATAVSGDGRVVYGSTYSLYESGFKWTQSAGLQPFYAIASPYAATFNGDIVVGESRPSGPGISFPPALMATELFSADLNVLLPQLGTTLPQGLVLGRAVSISSDGSRILCVGSPWPGQRSFLVEFCDRSASTPPTVVTQPREVTLCGTSSITLELSVVATGSSDLLYQWQHFTGGAWTDLWNGWNSVGFAAVTTSSTLQVQHFGAGAVLRCRVMDQCARAVVTDPITITRVAPVIASQPTADIECDRDIATFRVQVAESAGAVTYQWRKDGTNIAAFGPGGNPTAAMPELVVQMTDPSVIGSYDCVIASACGTVTSSSAVLSSLDCPPTFSIYIRDKSDSNGFYHVFVGLDEGLFKRERRYGFVPALKSWPLSAGRIQVEDNGPWSWKISFPIAPYEYAAARAVVDASILNPPVYYGLTLNCMDWAAGVADAAVVPLPPFMRFTPEPYQYASPQTLLAELQARGDGGAFFDGVVRRNPESRFDEIPRPISLGIEQLVERAVTEPEALARVLGVPSDVRFMGDIDVSSNSVILNVSGDQQVLAVDWGDGTEIGWGEYQHVYSPGSYLLQVASVSPGAVQRRTYIVNVSSRPFVGISVPFATFPHLTVPNDGLNPATPPCDSIDFNQNTVFPEDQDVIDFFNVLAGGECSPGNTCNDIDFNNNTVFPEDQDVIDFFTVLAGGECT